MFQKILPAKRPTAFASPLFSKPWPFKAALLLWVLPLLTVPAAEGAFQKRTSSAQGKVSVAGLVFDLKSPEGWRRRQAVEVLGNKKVASAVPELIQMWNDTDVDVRRSLVRALENIGDARGTDSLGRMISDMDKEVRRNAVRAVATVYVKSGSPETGNSDRRFAALFIGGGENVEDRIIEPDVVVNPAVIESLIQRLQDDDKEVREGAAKSLGRLQGHGAVPAMVARLKREQEKVVLLALLRSLARMGDRSIAGDLIPLIYYQDKAIHDEAMDALGWLRNPVAVPDLTKLYETDVEQRRRLFGFIPLITSDDLQIKAYEALACIGSAQSKKHFTDALAQPDPRYRQAAAEGLARIGGSDPVTVSAVSRQRLVENKDSARMAQSFALFRMGRSEYLEELIRGLEDGNEQAYSYLLELHGAEIPLLYPFLESSSPKLRGNIAEVLGWVGNAGTLKPLEALETDASPDVAAGSALAKRRIMARIKQGLKAGPPSR